MRMTCTFLNCTWWQFTDRILVLQGTLINIARHLRCYSPQQQPGTIQSASSDKTIDDVYYPCCNRLQDGASRRGNPASRLPLEEANVFTFLLVQLQVKMSKKTEVRMKQSPLAILKRFISRFRSTTIGLFGSW